MPRNSRASIGGYCYHVINRGNARQDVFHKDADYEAFLKAMRHACIELPMRVLAYCLMPNHFHFVVWPSADGDLSQWMHWVQNTHVRRYHQHYKTSGHLWQGRFKSFPIEEDEYLLSVLRYVERNPVRAKLVRRAENWKWSSARYWGAPDGPEFLVPGPRADSNDWLRSVNQGVANAELESVRQCVKRGTPFGSAAWIAKTAARLGLQSTLRPRGRPRKATSESEQQ
jgi:putative transposase